MDLLERTLTDARTYRRLIYLLSAMPLGLTWFVALVTVWSLCLGLVVTPLVLPLLIGLAAMTRGFAGVEAELARSLLEVDAQPPPRPAPGGGFWARLRGQFSPEFWQAQVYLLLRWFLGFPLAVALFALLAAGLAMVVAPAWVPFTHGGADFGFWRAHTVWQALVLVPVGICLVPAIMLVVGPVASGFGAIAAGLLSAEQARERETGGVMERMPSIPPRRRLEAHGALTGLAVVLFLVLWALSSSTYFWPAWILPPLVIALAVHAWSVLVAERPAVIARFGGSRALARRTGTGGGLALYLIVIWSLSNSSYFWPVWPLLVVATVLGGQAIMIMLGSERETEMAQRIEKLETTRAGAVDVQDSELRRIERDLHDGAQARLVALGMSLGMAEQKLSEDPARAGELLAEARAGAEAALRELRDLARGIHPPVLADRGLEAALRALANSAPLDVRLSVDVAERPSSAVESAAYFVAAEALANAAKHAQAQTLEIRIVRMADVLLLQVRDDGVGGADPSGSGLSGLRSRVEALDGSLQVTSPPGGPTTIRAQLPCG